MSLLAGMGQAYAAQRAYTDELNRAEEQERRMAAMRQTDAELRRLRQERQAQADILRAAPPSAPGMPAVADIPMAPGQMAPAAEAPGQAAPTQSGGRYSRMKGRPAIRSSDPTAIQPVQAADPDLSKRIEVSEANRRLQAMRNSPNRQAELDRAYLLNGVAQMGDAAMAPLRALSNLNAAVSPAISNTLGRIGNAITGEETFRTDRQGTFVDPRQFQNAAMAPVRQEQTALERLRRLQGEVEGAQPAAQPQPANAQPQTTGQAPRGIRNNNPGNLMFAGQPGATADPQGFAVFPTMQEGWEANVRQLQLYGGRGINTVRAIVNTWAPGNAPGNSAESTNNYMQHVASGLGVSPDTPLDMNNRATLDQLLTLKTSFENGISPAQASAIRVGQSAPATPSTQMPGQAPVAPAAPVVQAQPSQIAESLTPEQFFSPNVVTAMQQSTQLAEFRRNQLMQLLNVTSDPQQLMQIHTQLGAIQADMFETQVYDAAYRAAAGDVGALSQLVQVAGTPVTRLADGRFAVVSVDPATGQGRPGPAMTIGQLSKALYGNISDRGRKLTEQIAQAQAKAQAEAQAKAFEAAAKGQWDVYLEQLRQTGALERALVDAQTRTSIATTVSQASRGKARYGVENDGTAWIEQDGRIWSRPPAQVMEDPNGGTPLTVPGQWQRELPPGMAP